MDCGAGQGLWVNEGSHDLGQLSESRRNEVISDRSPGNIIVDITICRWQPATELLQGGCRFRTQD